MLTHTARWCALLGLAVALTASTATGYIHFPPTTLQKMCKDSPHVRVLKVEKFDKVKGVIVFSVAESLKGGKSEITSFKHVLRADVDGRKPILDWIEKGKTAVAFSHEMRNQNGVFGIGYVFIDDYCYTIDYTSAGQHWTLLRTEPRMSACYHGSAEQLRQLVKDFLDGKEIKVPTKGTITKEETNKRVDEITEAFKKTRP